MRTIKEKRCTVVQTAGGPDKYTKDREGPLKELKKPIKYVLPDGTDMTVGEEKYLAPEILFSPEKIGLEYPGIHEMLLTAINKADIDLRKDLYENIFIAGGGSKFSGFPMRIMSELKDKKLENVKVCSKVFRILLAENFGTGR